VIDLHSHSIFSDGTDTPEAMALAADTGGKARGSTVIISATQEK